MYKCSLVRWPGASSFSYVFDVVRPGAGGLGSPVRVVFWSKFDYICAIVRIGNISVVFVRSPSNWTVALTSLLWYLEVCGYGVNRYCLRRRTINWFAQNAGFTDWHAETVHWTYFCEHLLKGSNRWAGLVDLFIHAWVSHVYIYLRLRAKCNLTMAHKWLSAGESIPHTTLISRSCK